MTDTTTAPASTASTAPDLARPFALAFTAWADAANTYRRASRKADAEREAWEAANPAPRTAVWLNRAKCEALRHALNNPVGIIHMRTPQLSTDPADLARHADLVVESHHVATIWKTYGGCKIDGTLYRAQPVATTPDLAPLPDALQPIADRSARATAMDADLMDRLIYPAVEAEHAAMKALMDLPAPDLAALHAKLALFDALTAPGSYSGQEIHRATLAADMARLLPPYTSRALLLARVEAREERRCDLEADMRARAKADRKADAVEPDALGAAA